jgi:hypothetical protein
MQYIANAAGCFISMFITCSYWTGVGVGNGIGASASKRATPNTAARREAVTAMAAASLVCPVA